MTATWNMTGDHVIRAGTRYDRTRTILDENGDPWDFSDYDPATTGGATGPRMDLRTDADASGAAILSLGYTATAGDEGIAIVQPPTSGQLRIVIDADTSAPLSYTAGAPLPENRAGVYDLELEGLTAADVIKPLEGSFVIAPEVTR